MQIAKRFTKMELISLLSAVTLGLMAVTAPTVSAQDTTQDSASAPTVTTYDKWTLRCTTTEGQEVCTLNQRVMNSETNQTLALFQIRHLPNGQDIMLITVQLGVDLRKGAFIQVTETQRIPNLSYTVCQTSGCRIQFPLNPETIAVLRTAGEGRFVFGMLNAEQNSVFPISFDGFSAAYNAFVATQ